MSNITMTRSDADDENRSREGGNYSVKRDGVTVAMFVFDYKENKYPVFGNEADALAAAKSFMAIDDLVAALPMLKKINNFLDKSHARMARDLREFITTLEQK